MRILVHKLHKRILYLLLALSTNFSRRSHVCINLTHAVSLPQNHHNNFPCSRNVYILCTYAPFLCRFTKLNSIPTTDRNEPHSTFTYTNNQGCAKSSSPLRNRRQKKVSHYLCHASCLINTCVRVYSVMYAQLLCIQVQFVGAD